jgi:hypothetical protein
VDALLTVDTYKQKGNTNLNSLPDVLKNFSADAAQTIRKNPAMLKRIMSDVTAAKSGRLSKVDALLRIGKSMGSSGLIKGLTGTMQNTMFSAFEEFGVSKGTVASIMGATKTGVKAYMSGNLDDVNGLASLARQLTGKSDVFSVFDLAAEAAMASTIIDYAIRSGATDLMQEAVASVSDRSVTLHAFNKTYTVAVLSSNIEALRIMGETMTAGGVLSTLPDACKRILMFYKFADKTTPAQYEERTTELLAVLNHINPNWAKYQRNGEMIDNLEMFTYASANALTLLGRKPEYELPVMIAPSHKAAALPTLIRQYYPGVNL